jgi:ribose 5-phosphate isomerase B
MKIFIASDHAAFIQKQALIRDLRREHELIDLGPESETSVNYPDYAKNLVDQMRSNSGSVGILLCGSGIGMSMAANRFKGIRAALCRNPEDAKLAREHNNANVLCLGGRISPFEDILKITHQFLSTQFEGGRHQTRIDKLDQWGC